MKAFVPLRPTSFVSLLAAVAVLAAPAITRAQSNVPIVAHRIANVSVAAGTAQSTIKLKKTFALSGLSGPFVRFDTVFGTIDVALTPDAAPKTVANFLGYVNSGAYTNTYIHRSLPRSFIQGGGYTFFPDNSVKAIATKAPVASEFNVSNTRGTLAATKDSSDPDSATSQWFFNASDDNALTFDSENGGSTVFGRVLDQSGLDTMDALAAITAFDFGGPFPDLPVVDYHGGPLLDSNLLQVPRIDPLPLVPNRTGGLALLKVSVKKNSNPALVTASLKGSKLVLSYHSGQTGTAKIKVRAVYEGVGGVNARFTVTVQ